MRTIKVMILILVCTILCVACAKKPGREIHNTRNNAEETVNCDEMSSQEEESEITFDSENSFVEDETDTRYCDNEVHIELSKEEMDRIEYKIEYYYSSIGMTVSQITQIDIEKSLSDDTEGWELVACFEVDVKNADAKRYIIIGSNNNWEKCDVINEGY